MDPTDHTHCACGGAHLEIALHCSRCHRRIVLALPDDIHATRSVDGAVDFVFQRRCECGRTIELTFHAQTRSEPDAAPDDKVDLSRLRRYDA